MKDWRIVVAFDTDDTILIPNVATDDTIRTLNKIWYWKDYIEPAWYKHTENIQAYNWFEKQWCYMIVWSWTWREWAKRWADEFWLRYDEIRVKEKCDDVDLSIDDCIVDLGAINLKVKRINNQISRKDWNETKR